MGEIININLLFLFLLICQIGVSQTIMSSPDNEPQPGDVFREYSWCPANRNSETIIKGGGNGIEFKLPGYVDLKDAIKAEAVVEFGNIHLGIWGQAIQFNNTEWIPVPFPASVPEPKFAYCVMTVQTIAVSISSLLEGTNTFRMKVEEGEQPMTYTQLYGCVLRVYYDPNIKVHTSGKILTPKPNSKIAKTVDLTSQVNGPVAKVEYVGNFENIDINGDGIYTGWQYTFCLGSLTGNIGTSKSEPYAVSWDNSWVPDQKEPMQIAARITDNNRIIYMTEPVTNLEFSRGKFSVELCKPYDVPNGFSSCTYGTRISADIRTKTERFNISGKQKSILDAKLVFKLWKRHNFWGFNINSTKLTELNIIGNSTSELYFQPLRPLISLKNGINEFTINPSPDGGTDIEWPGVQVLIQYKKTP